MKEFRVQVVQAQEARLVAERRWLEEKGRADAAFGLLAKEQKEWRDSYEEIVRWMGRAGFGFGLGDPIPKRDEVRSDKLGKGRLSPVMALEEMIQDARSRINYRSPEGSE